jgi:formylglycine-generating enzyme required for sulfatase activity
MDEKAVDCCAGGRGAERPARSDGSEREVTADALEREGVILATEPATPPDERVNSMARLDGGPFVIGTDSDVGFPQDGEGPAREGTVDPFWIYKHAVSVGEFVKFVRATDYTTDAERYGWSFVFENFVPESDHEHVIHNVQAAPWWVAVDGATWVRPFGPSFNVFEKRDKLNHPVTHVSWRDARAYAAWAEKWLPTEAEWEYAARGGLSEKRYPWGDELTPDGQHRCNIWQGHFPERNTGVDGYVRTVPVDEYESNGFGLHNVAGNVWEWCADWFSSDYHTTDAWDSENPRGPTNGSQRVMRGGSHLCHRSWWNRYRVGARSKNTPDSSTSNIGFRCVVDVE